MPSPYFLLILALCPGLVVAGDDDREVRLADCPPKVRATIESHSRGGQLDEIEYLSIGDRELYIAEVELAGGIDLDIHVLGNGSLFKTREELPREGHPAFAKRLARERGGVLDDVEKEVSAGRTTYHLEIERRGMPDIDLVTDETGGILGETEEFDD